jgi:Zn-dependent peptidase ImmA (M78 family)
MSRPHTPTRPATTQNAQRAQSSAERLLARLRLREPPIDVDRVVRALGLRVVYESLGPEVYGLLIWCPKPAVICVNREVPEQKQRLVIAHEMGHVHLGHEFGGEEYVHVDRRWDRYRDCIAPGLSELDLEANQFAGELVMPTKLVREAVAALGNVPLSEEQVQDLAARFDVTVQSMTMRLSRLGLM